MHPITTMKHWSHQLHDGMATLRHHIQGHLHSHHIWAGVAFTTLIAVIFAAMFILARHAPLIYPQGIPYLPYGM